MALEGLLAALVIDGGGEVRVSYDALVAAHDPQKDRFVVIDVVEGGAALALTLADKDDVPDDFIK
jgi:hypothetical protein